VDFYVLASAEMSAQHLACRLAMMAWEQGHRISVLAGDETEARSLDETMWDYPAGRFLPHGIGDAGASSPVRIVLRESEIGEDRDVVINLGEAPLEQPVRFARLLEIVPGDPSRRAASRQKFRSYRDLGLEPIHHKIGKM
jgi:DNA polymerase-3 subunit chi